MDIRSHTNKVSLIITIQAHTRTHKNWIFEIFCSVHLSPNTRAGNSFFREFNSRQNLLESLQGPSTVLEADLATTGQWWTNEATSASCLPPTISQDKDIAFVSLTHSL